MLPRESLIHYYIYIKSILLLSLENSENSLGRISTIILNSGIVLVIKTGHYISQQTKIQRVSNYYQAFYTYHLGIFARNVIVIPFFHNREYSSKCWITREEISLNSSMINQIFLNYLLLRMVLGFNTLVTQIHYTLELLKLSSIMLLLANINLDFSLGVIRQKYGQTLVGLGFIYSSSIVLVYDEKEKGM